MVKCSKTGRDNFFSIFSFYFNVIYLIESLHNLTLILAYVSQLTHVISENLTIFIHKLVQAGSSTPLLGEGKLEC